MRDFKNFNVGIKAMNWYWKYTESPKNFLMKKNIMILITSYQK